MANWLQALKVKEISLVDRGANSGAVAVLMKQASEVQKDLVEKVKQFCTTLGVKFEDVQKTLENNGGEAMPTLDEVVKQMKEMGETITKVQGALALSNSIGAVSIALSKAKKKKDVEEQDGEVEKLDKNDPRVAVLKEMVTDLLAKSAKHDAYSENLAGDEKTKFESMPMKEKDAYMSKNPAAAEEGEGEEGEGNDEMEKRLQSEIKKNLDLRTRVEKMEAVSDIEKIRTDEMKDVEGITKDDAEAIYKCRISNANATNVLVAKIKSQAAQIKKNAIMLKELGLAQNGPTPGGAQEQLTALAVQKAKSEGITKEKAMSIILGTPEGKELYKRAEDEKPKTVAD
jgi:hypothetical protein